MQRGEPAVVGLVHISTVVGQLVDYSILPIVAPIGYTVYGILQAIILEWVAVPFSSRSSRTRN